MTIALGQKGRCTITGFEGVCVARTDYISGCTRVQLQPSVGSDGKLPDCQHFDEPMVEAITAGVKTRLSSLGGPRPDPVQHPAPVR